MQACDATAMQALNSNAFVVIDYINNACGGSLNAYNGNAPEALPFQDAATGACYGAASNSAATCSASIPGAFRLCACP